LCGFFVNDDRYTADLATDSSFSDANLAGYFTRLVCLLLILLPLIIIIMTESEYLCVCGRQSLITFNSLFLIISAD
jgi:hypothetical protein